MTVCTTFVGGINPFLASAKIRRVTNMQLTMLDGLKRYGDNRAYTLADLMGLSPARVREALLRLAQKGDQVGKRSGTGHPVYFLKETLQ